MIAIILGTRPEIIKFSPIIRALESSGKEFFILHTGQHYSNNLDAMFFKHLQLPEPKYNLKVGSYSHIAQITKMMIGIDSALKKEKPNIVLVLGDTNSALAGALVASKLHIRIGHVESGLRSYDRNMPEEVNRVLIDHCSDLLLAPTKSTKDILLKEGVDKSQVFVTGNTIVDAVRQNIKLVNHEDKRHLHRPYFLTTIHRTENVDNPIRFASILASLQMVAKKYATRIIYPIHPHSFLRATEYGLNFNHIDVMQAMDYLQFLKLEMNAKAILTDSGGLQEEACILGVPCVTLRDNTERPETVEIGANMIAGTHYTNVLHCLDVMLKKDNHWENPFGDGKAGERIVEIVRSNG